MALFPTAATSWPAFIISTIKKGLKAACPVFLFLFLVLHGGCGNKSSATGENTKTESYLLAQNVSTYNASLFGAMSRPEEAAAVFKEISGKVDGVEYETLFYSKADLEAHRAIAEEAKRHGIDLWATSFRLVERVRAFGEIPSGYQAWKMTPEGEIVRAVQNDMPLFDVMNPEAMDWFLPLYRDAYLAPFKGVFAGYFFNEDVIPYLGEWANDSRFDYWNNAVYSPAVLKLWQDYCVRNKVLFEGRVVDKFPVHRPSMVPNGKGLTEYYPGYGVPEKIFPGQRFKDLPRAEGVWKHWFDFICAQFMDNWIGRLAQEADEVNKDNTAWRGSIYFGLHQWSLPYEEIEDDAFTVPTLHRWGAWGRQRGVDLLLLSSDPRVGTIVCETFPPIEANLEFYIKEFKRMADSGGKAFGLMLHRDDSQPLDPSTEEQRWALIRKYRPSYIVRYPLRNMLSASDSYNPEAEDYFNNALKGYRKSMGNSSAAQDGALRR